MECSDCHNVDVNLFLEDRTIGDVICLLCGAVVPGCRLVSGTRDGRLGTCGLGDLPVLLPMDKGLPPSTPYNRVYHNSENLANYMDKDPRVPDRVLGEILDRVLATLGPQSHGTRDQLRRAVSRLQSKDIKRLCQSVSQTRVDPTERKRVKQYGERFVQIKKRLCSEIGAQMVPSYWLPASVLLRVRGDFLRLSMAFDATLYKPGRKRTRKDVELAEALPQDEEGLCRHNMISYNFIQHELVYKNAPKLYARAELDFFFPRPRTPKVLDKLTNMYNAMARYCGFPPSMLTNVADKSACSREWSLERSLRSFPPVLRALQDRELTHEEWLDLEMERSCERALLSVVRQRRRRDDDDPDWVPS